MESTQSCQANSTNEVPYEKLKVIIRVGLSTFAEIECDSLLFRVKETGGTNRYLLSRNTWMSCSNSEGMHGQRLASIVKGTEELHAVEKELNLLVSQPTQKKRQARNQTPTKNQQCQQEDSQMAKRQKFSVSKPFRSPPADVSLYEEDDNDSEDGASEDGASEDDASEDDDSENDDSKDESKKRVTYLKRTTVEISDDKGINFFYHCRLVHIGQSALRRILKAWIKFIQPKKQANNPYIGKEDSKPAWWPINDCRHTEPDHLHSKERLILAVWLLRLFGVKLLQRSTQDIALSLEEKRREEVLELLDSMYDVREQEQDFERGGRDGSSQIFLDTPKRIKWSTKPLYPRYPGREVIGSAKDAILRTPDEALRERIIDRGADEVLKERIKDLKLIRAPSASPPCDSERATNERSVGDAQVPTAIPAVRRSMCIDIAGERKINSYMNAADPSNNMLLGVDALEPGLRYGSGVSRVSSQTFHRPATTPELSMSNFYGTEHQVSLLPTVEQPMPPDSSCWRPSTIPDLDNEPEDSDDWVICVSSTRDEDNFENRHTWSSDSYENIPEVPAGLSFEALNDLDPSRMLTEEQASNSWRRNNPAPIPGILPSNTVPNPMSWWA